MTSPFFDLVLLGPLGKLIPLAVPETGMDNSPVAQATSSRSVNGRLHKQLQGVRRAWSIEQSWVLPEDVATLTSFYDGGVTEPLRIIDPLLKNRARASVSYASKSSVFPGGIASWGLPANNGVALPLPSPGLPSVSYTDVEGRTLSRTADSAIRWTPAAGGNMLYPNGLLRGDGTTRPSRVDPVYPGETVTYSFYTRQTGAGTHTFSVVPVGAGGTPLAATSTGALSSSSWTRRSLTYTVPSDGSVVGVFPRFSVSAATAVVDIGMGQLEAGGEATSWQGGYGAPEVDLTDLKTTVERAPYVTVSLSLTQL